MIIRLLIVLGFLVAIAATPHKAYSLTLTTPGVFSRAMVDVAEQAVRTQDRHVTIYMNGIGGNSSWGTQFIDKIHEARDQGKIVTIIINNVSSMHALAACAGTKLVRKGTMMFHIGRTDNRKRGGVMVYGSESDFRYLARDCVEKGVLTEQDIKDVVNHKEVFVRADGSRWTIQR